MIGFAQFVELLRTSLKKHNMAKSEESLEDSSFALRKEEVS